MSGRRTGETIQDRRHRLSSIPKACEGCRVRKIRCDRSYPCSNCRVARIVCQQSETKVESRPKSDRVTQLEELVERLEERLVSVEKQLGDRQAPSDRFSVDPCPTPLYTGESSFNSISTQATEVVAAFSQGARENDNLTASLNDLQDLLQPSSTLDDYQFSQNRLGSMPTITPLPSELVAAVVRSFKDQTPVFLLSYPMNDISMVENLCSRVYFPTEPVSLGHITSMHGMLLALFKEFIRLQRPLAKQYDLKAYLKQCEENFNAGIETYEMLVVPSFENILALTLGIIKSLDEAKGMLSYTLISVAARHCLMLGYHRASTYRKEPADKATNMCRIFWTIYMFDKNTSLLMGRTSCIQDFEIDVPYPTPSEVALVRPWDETFVIYIRLSQLQGQIYDRVYSATALKSSPSERAQTIESLTNDLEQWRAQLQQVDFSGVSTPEVFELSRPTWDIMYYSILTSLLRGSSTSTSTAEITSRCFQAARQALKAHLSCFPMYRESDIVSVRDYANWVMLYTSLTPFIVIFLHAIAASSEEDVQLLEDIVSTLQPIRLTSKASGRLYQICTIFARVARALVERRNSFLGPYNEQDDSLQLLNDTGQAFLFDPESLQDYFGAEMMDQFTYSEASDMSAILGSWASGQPPTVDILSMNFGESPH